MVPTEKVMEKLLSSVMYSGVNVTLIEDLLLYKSPAEKELILTRWERSLMGLKSSPYNCTRAAAWGEDFVRGDRRDPKNPFRWDKVILNMPGQESYDPRLPWVFRFDSVRNQVAACFCTYVDDIRSGDCSELEYVATTHTIASRINYLGQQDAPRKCRRISQQPGAWVGAMVTVSEGEGLCVTCSQQKWDNTKGIISRLLATCPDKGGTWKLDRKPKNIGERSRIFNPYLANVPNDGSLPSVDSSHLRILEIRKGF